MIETLRLICVVFIAEREKQSCRDSSSQTWQMLKRITCRKHRRWWKSLVEHNSCSRTKL